MTVSAVARQVGRGRRIAHRLKPWRVHFWLRPKMPRDEAFRGTVLEILDLCTRSLDSSERLLSL